MLFSPIPWLPGRRSQTPKAAASEMQLMGETVIRLGGALPLLSNQASATPPPHPCYSLWKCCTGTFVLIVCLQAVPGFLKYLFNKANITTSTLKPVLIRAPLVDSAGNCVWRWEFTSFGFGSFQLREVLIGEPTSKKKCLIGKHWIRFGSNNISLLKNPVGWSGSWELPWFVFLTKYFANRKSFPVNAGAGAPLRFVEGVSLLRAHRDADYVGPALPVHLLPRYSFCSCPAEGNDGWIQKQTKGKTVKL